MSEHKTGRVRWSRVSQAEGWVLERQQYQWVDFGTKKSGWRDAGFSFDGSPIERVVADALARQPDAPAGEAPSQAAQDEAWSRQMAGALYAHAYQHNEPAAEPPGVSAEDIAAMREGARRPSRAGETWAIGFAPETWAAILRALGVTP